MLQSAAAVIGAAVPANPLPETHLQAWEIEICKIEQPKRGIEYSFKQCEVDFQRENFNWEKHLMLHDYLELLLPTGFHRFTHVGMLDADAALTNYHIDSIGLVAYHLARRNKDLFMGNEDWLPYQKQEQLDNQRTRANGGLIIARNDKFSRSLFKDTFQAHVRGNKLEVWKTEGIGEVQCSSNEQICLADLMYNSRPGGQVFRSKCMLVSGTDILINTISLPL